MRILVTGASGMLGACIVQAWQGKYDVFATGRANFPGNQANYFFEKDLDDNSYLDILEWSLPDIIVHCAALTQVDYCEGNPKETYRINTESIRKLLEAGNARLLFISSDSVFADGLLLATEIDEANPETVYGLSKLEAEKTLSEMDANHVSIRTTIVGKNLNPHKKGFVEWIINSLQSGNEITLFQDAYFTPISIWHLAAELEWLFNSSIRGTLHVNGTEPISKNNFGILLGESLFLDTSLIKGGSIRGMDFKAKRSLDQTLSSEFYQKETGRKLPNTNETISRLVEAFR